MSDPCFMSDAFIQGWLDDLILDSSHAKFKAPDIPDLTAGALGMWLAESAVEAVVQSTQIDDQQKAAALRDLLTGVIYQANESTRTYLSAQDEPVH